MKKVIMSILTGAVMLLPVSAIADVAAEISTAQTHAGLAAKATDVTTVHMHLHHAVNCLVGPDGAGFDKTNMNPCANSGKGAIPDASRTQKVKLRAALSKARAGIATKSLATAQKDAQATADALAAIK